MLATLLAGSPAAVAAAHSEGLIVTDPLPGYERIEGGELDGAIDVQTLMDLAGTDLDEIPDEVRKLPGEARTWSNDAGAVAIALVFDCGDVNKVSDFLLGALDSWKETSDSTFEPGIAGTAGFVVEEAVGPVRIVVWRQHTYFVEVFVAGMTGDSSEADVKALAATQVDFLQSAMGAAPTLDTSRSTPDEGAVGQIGRVLGILFFVGIVAYMIWSSTRRKAQRRALQAQFAVPPRPFVPSGRTPAALPPPPFPPPSPPAPRS